MTRIAIVGATSGPGAALLIRLLEEGRDVVSIGRSRRRLDELLRRVASAGLPTPPLRRADLRDDAAMTSALADCTVIIDCSDPHYVPRLLAALPKDAEHFITLGSTRRYGAGPDQRADDVKHAESLAHRHGVPATVLHPTLIYGAWNDSTVTRIWRFVRVMPVVPLPGAGRALMQPIFIDDVVDCLVAAIDRPDAKGKTLVIAGPAPVSTADFVRACGRAIGRRVFIAPVPLAVLQALAVLSQRQSVLPRIQPDQIARLMDDKRFDVAEMKRVLGIMPKSLNAGLRLLAERTTEASRSNEKRPTFRSDAFT